MFGFIKNIFRKKASLKLRSTEQTGLIPLAGIRSAIVLVDLSDSDCGLCRLRIDDFCRENNITVSYIFVDMRTEKQGLPPYSGWKFITRRTVNWFGLPDLRHYQESLTASADLFINLSSSDIYTFRSISESVRCRMKIGMCDYPSNVFDIVFKGKSMDESSGSRRTLDRLCSVLKFIKQVV